MPWKFAARCPDEPVGTVPLTISRGRLNPTAISASKLQIGPVWVKQPDPPKPAAEKPVETKS